MRSGKQRSVSASHYAMTPAPDIPRSAFDLSHTHKTTFKGGALVPIFVDEILPGDHLRLKLHAFVRLATPIVPAMDNLWLESFFFFVPNRLVWSNWTRFMGEQLNPADTTAFLLPQVEIPIAAFTAESLQDYFGITMDVGGAGASVFVNALPFRAYALIWNQWFRDQDLQNPISIPLTDGPDAITSYVLQYRAKRHDYFTSARPWPQKPLGAVSTGVGPMSLGQYAPGQLDIRPQAGAPVSGITSTGAVSSGPFSRSETGGRGVTWARELASARIKATDAAPDYPDVRVLINDIRTANMIQAMMERNARSGTRYTEILQGHFRVQSPDARLQRPEYLGGGRTAIQLSPVAQTSASDLTGSTSVLGELSAVGTAAVAGHGFSSSFVEHGYVIGMINVRADLTYQQGIERMWHRRTQYDFYWPGLAHLGEQAVLSKEIFSDGTANDLTVFGYQERWAEYRSKPGRISGLFRFNSVAAQLDMWHFAQEFITRPTLGTTFMQDPTGDILPRVLQFTGLQSSQFLGDFMVDLRYVRCMPMFSIPGLGPRL